MSDSSTSQTFSMLSSAQLMDVLEPYSLHLGLNVHALFFRFDGQLILPYMTPEQLGMEDEDIIDVYVTKPSETSKRGREDDENINQCKRGAEDMMQD